MVFTIQNFSGLFHFVDKDFTDSHSGEILILATHVEYFTSEPIEQLVICFMAEPTLQTERDVVYVDNQDSN